MAINFLNKNDSDVAKGSWGSGSGGAKTTFNSRSYHAFTSSGTFNVSNPGYFEVLVIGGGGAGGYNRYTAGGGGAGAAISATVYLSAGSHPVVVGAGGAHADYSVYYVRDIGGKSSFAGIVAPGGATGHPRNITAVMQAPCGACGGGGAGAASDGTESRYGHGYIGFNGGGGRGSTTATSRNGGGGGGMGAAGGGDVVNGWAGPGGDGTLAYAEWALATGTGDGGYYCGGGGGASGTYGAGRGGRGGGGKGDGGAVNSHQSGFPNTGGGGGGGHNLSLGNALYDGDGYGYGGSGLVIVRYVVA